MEDILYWSTKNRVYDCDEDSHSIISKGQYPNCADYVFICFDIDYNIITNAVWDGDGSTIMQASAGLICQYAKNKTLNDLYDFIYDLHEYFLNENTNVDIKDFVIFKDIRSFKGLRSLTVPFSAITMIGKNNG